MKKLSLMTAALMLLLARSTHSAERLVPVVYENIQAAIEAANDGDVVLIAPGTYVGPGNRDIDLRGKAVTVRSIRPEDPKIVSATVIDCQSAGRAFIFRTGEDADSVISGLTIANGKNSLGGAIYCQIGASPTIANCVIKNCSATMGGAIACGGGSSPAIANCEMTDNSALMGGAIYCNAGNAAVFNSLLVGNKAGTGGAAYCTQSSSRIANCTLSGNSSGIYSSYLADVTVLDSILWADTPGPELFVSKSGSVSMITVSFCDVQGGRQDVVVDDGCILSWAYSNRDADPVFAAGPLGDYYLGPLSPCVNAGSAESASFGLDQFTTSADGEPDADTVDMGYHRRIPNTLVTAIVDLKPETLNLAANGRWLTCSIQLPGELNVADIVAQTLELQDEIMCEKFWLDQPGVAMAKFGRSLTREVIEVGSNVEVKVSGQLADGTLFIGTDTIRVIDNGRKAK